MKITRVTTLAAVGAAAALTLAGCAANEGGSTGTDGGDSSLSGTVAAAGASSQAAAQEAWVAAFQGANTGVTVNYESTGSGPGRERFTSGASAFIGSDRAFNDDEIAAGGFGACVADTNIVEVPLYISPVAVAFNLDGIDSLNLNPDTIAGIFAGTITNWNDPAIAETNADVTLPDLNISPVHRADDSGTTETFTHYLNATAPTVWTHEADGVWPLQSGEAGTGTSGMVQAINAGNGTIGYADASQVGDLGQAHVMSGDQFIPYSAEAASMLVEASPLVEGRSAGDLVFDVDPAAATDGAYPIALVSYLIACEQYEDQNTAAIVKAYFEYMASPEGQQAAAENAGSAPISEDLRTKVLAAIDLIQVG